MPIGDLIDMERECSNPDCQHKRGAHGGTYYKRACGVINCVCKEFAEVKYSRTNTTWDGLVAEANRLDNQIAVWKIRQKQTEDANRELREASRKMCQQVVDRDNAAMGAAVELSNLRKENQMLREELAKCQEVLELMRQAGHLPLMLGNYLLGPDQSIEDETGDIDFASPDYEDC